MKKLVAASLALGIALVATPVFAEGNKLGYTCMDGTNPFFVALEDSIRDVVEANGDELISGPAEQQRDTDRPDRRYDLPRRCGPVCQSG